MFSVKNIFGELKTLLLYLYSKSKPQTISNFKLKAMQHITKYFKSLKAAEKYQNSLYSKFPYVVLLSFPIYSEEGQYTWEISM